MLRFLHILKAKLARPAADAHCSADRDQSEASFASLIDGLEGLGRTHVPAGARERTWAEMRARIGEQGSSLPAAYRRPARRFLQPVTVAAVAFLAAAVALAGYGLSQNDPQILVSDSSPGVTATMTSEDTTSSESTAPGGGVAGGSTTVRPAPSTTEGSSPNGTGGITGTTQPPSTTEKTAPPTSATSPPSGTVTTKPPLVTTTTVPEPTTSDTLLTKEERERDARVLVQLVAEALIRGDIDGAASHVGGGAMSGLVQMQAGLNQPYGSTIISIATPGPVRAKVLLEMWDREPDGQGGFVELRPRFVFDIESDSSGSTIVGIYAGPSQ
jgi:hypothetical protein